MFRRRVRSHEIAPDEIFLDSSNLPGLETERFEGRVERPVSPRAIVAVSIAFVIICLIYGGRAFELQIARGATFAEISRNNTLERWPLFSARGLILDRKGRQLAWNEAPLSTVVSGEMSSATSSRELVSTTTPYALRRYIEEPGFSVLLGFLRYPKADRSGTWWREEYAGIAGVELQYDSVLSGKNGSKMLERDAMHTIVQENITTPPESGEALHLSIDADVQMQLYKILSEHARGNRFLGGAAAIMDVRTGELLAMVSFPEYDNQAFTDGDAKAISHASNDSATPMLDRAISGLYTPGSIVKPIFAAAALNEGIISPDKQIESVGAITLPNPYNPDQPSVFRDRRAHGWVDMRTALAVSSDEYFYTIGGGYGGQQGLGIARIDEYAKRFGLGVKTGIEFGSEQSGTIPTPQWKAKVFGPDDPWRIGDTYHTAIGQYGFQITPLQAALFTAAIANGGKLLTPQLIAGSTSPTTSV